ncbi:hypothetical protein ACH5RR_029790 [Cinchona calisaya]|uniref:Reverse transcriptase zinc-binding domain-containing protein n=1 Tax=Cinchona calisaya TaxID=153742 RepID=A0ABD2YSP5_9GENT
MQVSADCVFCGANESMEYLFFNCDETYKILDKVKRLGLIQRDKQPLSDELKWMSEYWRARNFVNQVKKWMLGRENKDADNAAKKAEAYKRLGEKQKEDRERKYKMQEADERLKKSMAKNPCRAEEELEEK